MAKEKEEQEQEVQETAQVEHELLAKAVSMLEKLTADVEGIKETVESQGSQLEAHAKMLREGERTEAGFEPAGREIYEKHHIFGPALEKGTVKFHRVTPRMDYDHLEVNGLVISLKAGVPMETITPFRDNMIERGLI